MNAQTPRTHYTRAITEQILNAPVDFARQLRADADQLATDLRAGRLVNSHGGVFTREEIGARVHLGDGVYLYPTRSCGPLVDALREQSK